MYNKHTIQTPTLILNHSSNMGTTILQWSCNNLSAHNGELKHYLSNTTRPSDIIAIKATKFKKASKFTLDGYNIVWRDKEPEDGVRGKTTFFCTGFMYKIIDSSKT